MALIYENKYFIPLIIAVLAIASVLILETTDSGFTGYVVSVNGTVNVTIVTTESITFRVSNVDFGTGYVNTTGGANNCTLIVNGTNSVFKSVGCAGFAETAPLPLLLENDGNKNVSIQLGTNKNATVFIGGGVNPIAEFQYLVQNNETGACSSTPTPATFTNVNVTSPGTTICPDLQFADDKDELRIAIRILIPYDAQASTRNATFTATGTAN